MKLSKAIIATLLIASAPSASALTLKEAIEDAIINNPDFREQVKSYRANEAELDAAHGGYLPSIDLSAELGYETQTTEGDNPRESEGQYNQASVTLTQNLFNAGGTSTEIKRQEYRKDAQAYTVIASAGEVAVNMAESYINLIRHEELLKLSEDNLETHKKILDQILKRSKAGLGNQVEVDQAKARYALAQSNYAASQNEYYDAQAEFRKNLGRDQDNNLIRPKFNFPLPKTIEEATQKALVDHPTLRAANGDIAEARAQYEATDSLFYPSIDLVVTQSYTDGVGGFDSQSNSLKGSVNLSWNLYNGGTDTATVARNASSYHQATEIRNQTRRQIIENLRFSWNAHKYINLQLKYVDDHINLTHDTLRGYRKQFNLGRRSLLDLLNTENEYVSALRTLINNEHDALIAKYKILSATGHLLREMQINYQFIQAENHPDE